jgi:hypothetical protein
VKGVQVEWMESLSLRTTVADVDALATGWASLLNTILDVAREGDCVHVVLNTPRIRPAIILEVTLQSANKVANVDRFLDTEWRDHPAGQAGGVLLASALLSAQLQGGRMSAAPVDGGMTVSYVVPQPLDH